MTIAGIIMAAGEGKRFGGDKVFAEFDGQPLYLRMLRTAQEAACFSSLTLVARAQDVQRMDTSGVRVCMNETRMRSCTVRLGVQAAGMADAVVFLPCDQPLLGAAHLRALVNAFCERPQGIYALGTQGKAQSPVLFSRAYFGALAALEGTAGGKQVLQAHRDQVRVVEAPIEALADADTQAALAVLEAWGKKT